MSNTLKLNVQEIATRAKEELAEERANVAKVKIKRKLQEIEAAKKIVDNLEAEFALLLKDLEGNG